jgi:hypothetical protein
MPFNLSKLHMPNLKDLKESTNNLDYVVAEIEKHISIFMKIFVYIK